MTRNHSSVESGRMKVRRRFLVGGIIWGVLLLAGAFGLAADAVRYLTNGEKLRALIAIWFALGIGGWGVIMFRAIFSKD